VIAEPPQPAHTVLSTPVRVLLLDDDPLNLLLRTAILRQNGYDCIPTTTIEDATEQFDQIDIAVLDYHLGAGQFGTEAAALLRRRRPHVPIIILSATIERFSGGIEDIHLLKGYSSVDELLSALRTLEAKRHGSAAIVDSRDFYYSRLALAIGSDVIVQIFDQAGTWLHCNSTAAQYFGKPLDWFIGRNIFEEMPHLTRDWRDVIVTVAQTRETYIDRTYRGLLSPPQLDKRTQLWSVLAFPITLHDGRNGVVLTARTLPTSTPGDLSKIPNVSISST
jgi:two-component system, OmpR family, response regulator